MNKHNCNFIFTEPAKKSKKNNKKPKSTFDKELTNTSKKSVKKLRTGWVLIFLSVGDKILSPADNSLASNKSSATQHLHTGGASNLLACGGDQGPITKSSTCCFIVWQTKVKIKTNCTGVWLTEEDFSNVYFHVVNEMGETKPCCEPP